ncbi:MULTISPECIES: hypothetical protein [Nitrosomonas]|uniref:Transmembrane protein n=1 Tax=Nitrosomonas europaea (strain ATCC 19718 / CIP 103999 / KCTC 2705 / NBRC 14298) TaxID=228410 RepID=Q82TD3_NITEU|nr:MULTISPECIES: hypothetical protein [Nitrosomonas]KXK44793.1 MAG: hypothetical protein UZ02_AOB001001016 [Nitrosomonas europaea]MBV6390547.1 hypothetical protein [Nitrosomonas europaea]MEB2331761.1 hypothetical protein [Nitrosomonas sp.]QOJ09438.1 MAG: hypothetical protein HRU73_08240 [Nitrosomonas sp. H1_AOB3]CAD85876.1 hypothetical protein NE1965 [Nitrosomonas europaea ATCC 19718]
MEDTAPITTLLYSILALPIAFMILYWTKVRKDRRRNETGEIEYKSLGHALTFFIIEGLALVGSLSILITAVSGIVRYLIYVYA